MEGVLSGIPHVKSTVFGTWVAFKSMDLFRWAFINIVHSKRLLVSVAFVGTLCGFFFGTTRCLLPMQDVTY
jgi:hypothetical protein